MREITNSTDCLPYCRRRYKYKGADVAVAPRVRALNLKPLNKDNIRFIKVRQLTAKDTQLVGASKCPLHEGCSGHFEGSESVGLGVPSFYRNDEIEAMNKETVMTMNLLNGNMSNANFAIGLRNLISGKRGLLKYGALGCRPLTSMRGVATINWSPEPTTVMIPRQWMINRQIPYRVVEYSDDMVQPKFSSRELVDGDYGILSRAPAISDESVQPVKLMGWDECSVGVHPEMCALLNLDFDGDEVHVVACIEEKSRGELIKAMNLYDFGVFSAESISKELSQMTGKRENFSYYERQEIDFMVRSTRCFEDLQINEMKFCSYDNLCGVKESSWNKFRNEHCLSRRDADEYYNAAVTGISQMTESHINVSDAFTFGRQLKHSTAQINVENSLMKCGFGSGVSDDVIKSPIYKCPVDSMYGFPATRLATRVSLKFMQSMLDRAKGKGSAEGIDFVISLMSKVGDKGEIVLPFPTPGVIITNSRQKLALVPNSKSRMSSCLASLSYACKLANIKYNSVELSLLSYFLYCTLSVEPSREISSKSGVEFMYRAGTKILHVGACDDIYKMDMASSDCASNSERKMASNTNPIISIILGNFYNILQYSKANF
ncbi:hypothetical protein DFH28DRAFT_1015854 [Melampsora americana]|nr:hypothetical protein DFH28DRAFT_1015854 [Melampsora americana]